MDRAALDAALKWNIRCGGFVPKGRLAEDGPIPSRYPVKECGSKEYSVRTKLNVEHSGAALILNRGDLSEGTLLTLELCRKHRRPVRVIQLDKVSPQKAVSEALDFLQEEKPRVLNVAGPRESKSPGIYEASRTILTQVFQRLQSKTSKRTPSRA